MSKEIAEDYASSLADLTVNSKPLINMLTILAEENIEHAGAIVETVEKHLEKVQPEIKLPVLYLVDSIIKNVGGAYAQKFAQSIVNMFTRTFKQVDEKTRSQMFKLRETWHDVFPGTKLYQLDVKVNLIDPAWPIQAQPQQSNIHVNPNFLKKTVATTSAATPVLTEEEKAILAKKEQELLMLQNKKIEMELEHTKKLLELAEKNAKKTPTGVPSPAMPVALVNPVMAPVVSTVPPEVPSVSVKQRLGPPVHKPSSGRIAPVSGALISARRDPRLARRAPPTITNPTPTVANTTPTIPPIAATIPPIAPHVFDIKPLERITKRKNVITIDVRPDAAEPRMPQRDPRVRDPRLERRDPRREKLRREERRKNEEERRKVDEERRKVEEERRKVDEDRRKADEERRKVDEDRKKPDIDKEKPKNDVTDYIEKLQLPDPKKINKLPPIPKINRDEGSKDLPVPNKRRKEIREKKKKREEVNEKDSDKESSNSLPEKQAKNKEIRKRMKDIPVESEPEKPKETVVEFKELKNYKKDRYMRRNKEKSESPENTPEEKEKTSPNKDSSNASDMILENKDVDLRVLPVVDPKPAIIGQKRSSTETIEGKMKKTKLDKFDILFGNEDVDLRQLPQVEEINPPPPPVITESPKKKVEDEKMVISPRDSPKQKDWNEVKEKDVEETKKTPSKLDLVRAKLAEATKGKDRLGRPLLFTKSPSIEKERRRTLSDRAEDTEQKNDSAEDFDATDHKKSISIIMSQAKEQFNDGQLDKNQYNTLMYQVLQLNEKLKLKEAKQRESLEISKRKLKAHIDEENNKVPTPKSSPNERNNFGDIDERVTPSVFLDTPPDSQSYLQDSDMRVNPMSLDGVDGPKHHGLLPMPMMPMFGPYNPMWRGQPRPRMEDYGPRRFRGPLHPFHRGKFDKRALRPPFEPRLPLLPPLPTPQMGMCQNEYPLRPYERTSTPPPLGAPGVIIPPTDYTILEYIDQDPVKTIQIDGVPREIRFYGDTAIIMLDWDDPREIKFLPGCRRITFDNKDSVVLSFNEGYKQVEIDDQVFDIKFGAPTRELYINGRWHECFFGGQPLGVIIDGKPRLVHLEGPLPQVDIGKVKRTDLVAGKINLIVNATVMCPVYLDAKVQKFHVNGLFFTIRFVDSLKTVLINEQPFQVEFGDLPKPIFVGDEKYFVRFSALPKNIKPGYIKIANMEGESITFIMPPKVKVDEKEEQEPMETDEEQPVTLRPNKTPSPDMNQENQGLDVLASVMPSSTAPASASEYSLAEPLFLKPDKIPGLETPSDEVPANPVLPIQNINVNDLFQKLVAIGIVKPFGENNEEKPETKVEDKPKPKEDKSVIHKVDLLKPETLRVKQPGIVARLYGGMQCSGCGVRFPPEHTVRYSQHLDWHFRQNRRERDSARRAHSRHWHYDLPDWVQYEEVEDLDEREKSWFETGGAEGETEGQVEVAEETPSVAAGLPHEHVCALCGDKFDQFYNEDKEEWHLRNSVRHEDKNYHPLCFDDYKASLTKDEPIVVPTDEVKPIETIEEAIEIKDVDEEINDHSDNESVVEVIETEPKDTLDPVEIDEGDEDDVVLKAEPVEEVVVEDDADTDDETTASRAERDRLAMMDFTKVKIKQEPVDPDDEPIITEEETIKTNADTTHTTVLSSIDGNIQFETTPTPAQTLPIGGIRINISKSIPSFITNNDGKMFDDISADDEPLPPGEEPELEYKLKPALEGVQLRRQPPLNKGNELSGLCSIM